MLVLVQPCGVSVPGSGADMVKEIEVAAQFADGTASRSVAYAGSCLLADLAADRLFPTLPQFLTAELDDAERSATAALLAYGIAFSTPTPALKQTMLKGIFRAVVFPRLAAHATATGPALTAQPAQPAQPAATALPELSRTRGEQHVERVVTAMRARIEYNWTLSELAEQAAMSRSSFISRFKRRYALPPMSYLTKVRMQRATELLKSSLHELSIIAEAVGYSSESAFCRVYKRETGTSPAAFRRACQAAQRAESVQGQQEANSG